jgi:cardiolipin synthase
LNVEVAGNSLTVFTETAPMIAALTRDIAAAHLRVWVETYIFANDDAGRAVADALKERARAGVPVRVLYDAVGSQATPAVFFRSIAESGVAVRAFHPVWEALWRLSFFGVLNRRNHRKLIVIDDRVAYFGGMNLIDTGDLRDTGHSEHKPVSAGWRDVHVRLEGPKQAEMILSFDRSWRLAHGEKVSRRPRSYRSARLPTGGGESIQLFDAGPGQARAARLFTHLIRAARRSITLSMAYFLPVGRVLRALRRAARNDVRVRVVVPADSDVPLVQAATRHLYTYLLRRRIRVYERGQRMLHGKVMIVDDEWSVVGSCNLDARSLYFNHEFMAVVRSSALAEVLRSVVDTEIALGERIRYKEYRERHWWRRLLNWCAWLLRWWL